VGGDAGIVHEEVEPAKLIACGTKCALPKHRIRDVARDANGPTPELRYLRCNFRESIFTSCDENEIRAALCEFNCERTSDAARGAGDEPAAIR